MYVCRSVVISFVGFFRCLVRSLFMCIVSSSGISFCLHFCSYVFLYFAHSFVRYVCISLVRDLCMCFFRPFAPAFFLYFFIDGCTSFFG